MRLKSSFSTMSMLFGFLITAHFSFGQLPNPNLEKSYTGIWMGTILREGGGLDKGSLWIEFKSDNGKILRISLTLTPSNDLIYLRDKNPQINQPYSFSLAKIGSDTSSYIKPKGEIKVRITKRTGIL